MRRGQSSSKSPCTFKDKSIASAAGKKGAKGGVKDSARKAIAQSPALVEDKTLSVVAE